MKKPVFMLKFCLSTLSLIRNSFFFFIIIGHLKLLKVIHLSQGVLPGTSGNGALSTQITLNKHTHRVQVGKEGTGNVFQKGRRIGKDDKITEKQPYGGLSQYRSSPRQDKKKSHTKKQPRLPQEGYRTLEENEGSIL